MGDRESYRAQSRSLGASNLRGQRGESIVLNLTGGENLRLPYSDIDPLALLQSDCVLNLGTGRELILSTTHTKPDTKGHSNENKFQLKLGEMWLWKTHRPHRRVVIVLTGRKDQWLPWCLTAFKFFFDDAIFEWEPNFETRISNANRETKHRNAALWEREVTLRNKREALANELIGKEIIPRFSKLRHRFFEEEVPKVWQLIDHPNEITNGILRSCMKEAHKRDSKEWQHIRRNNNTGASHGQFWQCRTFFNPAEASIAATLNVHKIPYRGGIAMDVQIPSFMSSLAKKTDAFEEFNRTKMSEDFVLAMRNTTSSPRLIYIQSKSSGGGLKGHGKAIQNRAKEQIARNLLYRLRPIWSGKELVGFKDVGSRFLWVGVIDNNWGRPKKNPTKNLRSLILAGYDMLFYADELLNDDLTLKIDSPLALYLLDLRNKSKGTTEFFLPEYLEYVTEHDEAEHGKPGATASDFDY